MRQNDTPPVEVGEELDVTVQAVGEKGDGIARIRGFVVFVPDTKKGQRVKIRVTKVLQKVGFGQVIGEATTKPKELVVTANELEPVEAEPEPEDSTDFGEELEE